MSLKFSRLLSKSKLTKAQIAKADKRIFDEVEENDFQNLSLSLCSAFKKTRREEEIHKFIHVDSNMVRFYDSTLVKNVTVGWKFAVTGVALSEVQTWSVKIDESCDLSSNWPCMCIGIVHSNISIATLERIKSLDKLTLNGMYAIRIRKYQAELDLVKECAKYRTGKPWKKDDGQICNYEGNSYGQPFRPGDIIKVQLYKPTRQVEFFINGISRGIAWSDVVYGDYRFFVNMKTIGNKVTILPDS